MQKLFCKFMAPAIAFATIQVGELPASTFGGSTGPRQGTDEILPRVEIDPVTYDYTQNLLRVEEHVLLVLPGGTYKVIKSDEEIVEINLRFQVVPRE